MYDMQNAAGLRTLTAHELAFVSGGADANPPPPQDPPPAQGSNPTNWNDMTLLEQFCVSILYLGSDDPEGPDIEQVDIACDTNLAGENPGPAVNGGGGW